ncbi:putative 4-coumarate--CoA ligase-like 7 [Iris pallida]|uniref:4-coumarate--CoA ligase n=1 Tax=Iris pallida TaxID=29817 RepID=A0AAX6EAD0_IRIPA|nr:putative 4-coumarate--CoA ligase-like 7 [Iris pallida]
MSKPSASSVDRKSGFCSETRTFRSLRPPVLLPPDALPLSFTSYAFSLLPSPLPSNPALLDAATDASLSYPDLLARVRSLSSSLADRLALSKGDVALVLSPSTVHLPVLYLSLLSLGVVFCPANPVSTPAEISHQCRLVAPVSVAFATSSAAPKLPPHLKSVIILDSPQFHSLLLASDHERPAASSSTTAGGESGVLQSDAAAIQFSSGTTGRIKAAAVPHRAFIAMAAAFHQYAPRRPAAEVTLLAAPMFHSLGLAAVCGGLVLGRTTVVMESPGFAKMLRAAAKHRATTLLAAPPVVVAMARSEEVDKYDLGALEAVFTGGAPVPEEVARRFMARFPGVQLRQGYGSTEGGGIATMISNEECSHLRSVGRLGNVEAKLVDVKTGKALSVGQQGELYVRGPAVMIGYVGDYQANESTFDSEGWLKTGDLCYFDNEGYLYIVDRLKELIKYKAYQVPPAELEHLLHSIPDVLDAVVVPYPQEDVGQIPLAFVVRKPGSNLSEAKIMDYVAKQVAPYKKIRKVLFINSIPKSATGKTLRRELATRALGGSRL